MEPIICRLLFYGRRGLSIRVFFLLPSNVVPPRKNGGELGERQKETELPGSDWLEMRLGWMNGL